MKVLSSNEITTMLGMEVHVTGAASIFCFVGDTLARNADVT